MRRGGIYLYISQAILGHSQLQMLVKQNYTNLIQEKWGLHFLYPSLIFQWTCGDPNIDIPTNLYNWQLYIVEWLWNPQTIITTWIIIEIHNINLVYEWSIILFSKSLIFKLPLKKKLTCLFVYRYEWHFYISFVDNQNMNYVIWFRIFGVSYKLAMVIGNKKVH